MLLLWDTLSRLCPPPPVYQHLDQRQLKGRRWLAAAVATLAAVCGLAVAVRECSGCQLDGSDKPGWAQPRRGAHSSAYPRLHLRRRLQVPSVWLPLQLVGATAGAAIVCILPGALSLSQAGWRLGTSVGSGGALLIATGLLLAATGIAGAIV